MKLDFTPKQARAIVQRIGPIASCQFQWSDGAWWCWSHSEKVYRRPHKDGPPAECGVRTLQRLFPNPYREDGTWDDH